MEFRDRDITITSSAAFDMNAAFFWYELRRPGLGEAFLRECHRIFQTIAQRPQTYREVLPRRRRALLRRFPFLVFFEAIDERVVIHGVVHVRQSPSSRGAGR